MRVYRFARVLDDMQSKLIDKQGRESITAEVKIRKFLYNISDVIKKSITCHLTDDVTYDHIVTKSEQFEGANGVPNTEHIKQGYYGKIQKYTNVTGTRSSYAPQQTKPEKDQLQQNRQATPGARSTASAGTKNSERYKIKKT